MVKIRRIVALLICFLFMACTRDSRIMWICDSEPSVSRDSVVAFVEDGGNLVLVMEAVTLVNSWGLDSVKVRSWNSDGTLVGMSPCFYHPVFDGFGYEGYVCGDGEHEFYGFVGADLPSLENSKVVAVYLHDGECDSDRKVIWEYTLGKGRILAVGGGFSHGGTLAEKMREKKLKSNIKKYLLGSNSRTSPPLFWEFGNKTVSPVHSCHDHINCKICAAEYKPVKPAMPVPLSIPKGRDRHMAKDVIRSRSIDHIEITYAEVAGLHSVWMDNVRVVHDYRPLVDIKGLGMIVPLSDYVPHVESMRDGFVRYYQIDGVCISEYVALCPDCSSVLVHYEWDSDRVRQLFTESKSDLRFRSPLNDSALMSLLYVWSLELNATVVRDESKRFVSVLGANVPGRPVLIGQEDEVTYRDWRVNGVKTDRHHAVSSVVYDVRGIQAMDVVIAGSINGLDDFLFDYAYALRNPGELIVETW